MLIPKRLNMTDQIPNLDGPNRVRYYLLSEQRWCSRDKQSSFLRAFGRVAQEHDLRGVRFR